MKLVLCLVLAMTIISSETCSTPTNDGTSEKYTTKYDNVNLDEILKSDRLLRNYVDCLLDKGKCTADSSELKKNLPDAIDNDCSKCSEKQKEGSEKVIHYIIDNKPEWWSELEKKYNPDGSYKKAYLKNKEEEVKKIKAM